MEEWCCEEFKEANERGTDAEGYGSAINFYEGHYRIGIIKIKFCPFCGKELK